MALNLHSLDDETRKHMLVEFEADVANRSLYLSPRLSERGCDVFPDALRRAIVDGDDSELAKELGEPGVLNATETRRTKNGFTTAKVPVTAATTLAEGEFNRFYIRGLCLRIIESDDAGNVEVYRARESSGKRSESEQLIGRLIEAKDLLEDLRVHRGEEPTLLPQVNSGLSVRKLIATTSP